jgi:hypothetical protein
MKGQPDKPEYRLAVPRGTFGCVRFARTTSGEEPAFMFWEQEMNTKQQAAFATLFRMIVSNNNLQLPNRQKFRQVVGELFEFKSNAHQMRIFCFRRHDSWYLTSGFSEKKEDDLPPGEVKRAIEIMENCQKELDIFLQAKALAAQRASRN